MFVPDPDTTIGDVSLSSFNSLPTETLNKWTFILPGVLLALTCTGETASAQSTDHWETLILPGSQCRYVVPSSQLDPEWTATSYDDSGWATGTGGVGYGDDDDNTIVDQVISVYCRYPFTLDYPDSITQLVLDMDFDDGFVAYLNGSELARYNMGETGTPTSWDQPADGLHEADLYQGYNPMRFLLNDNAAQLLVAGDNIFALEVHNASVSSSDLSSNPYLSAGLAGSGSYYHATPDWFHPPYSFDSTLLPLLVIETEGQEIPNEPKIPAAMRLVDNGPGEYNRTGDPGNGYSGRIAIELRGESSLYFYPKQSYGFETQTDSGTNNNVSLLGLPPENDWILYGPYSDKTLVRNVLCYRLFAEMGHYAPRTRFVQVVVNEDYKGIYVLTEKIKRDKNRVDMAKLLPGDISGNELTGGYLLRVDKLYGEPASSYWVSPVTPPLPDYQPVTYQYFDPKDEELNDIQKSYIQDYMLEFESVMTDHNFKDPDQGYRAYLDIPSFVDLMILNEFSKDVDGFRLSHYFYKQKDSNGGKLVSGPPWDYNLTFGNSDFSEDMHQTYNWVYTYPITIYWWARAMEDAWFRNQVRCRWDELRETVLSSAHLYAIIDSARVVMGASIDQNFERWPIFGTYIWPNSYVGQDYDEEAWFLKNWIDERLTWMDGRWGGQCWALSAEDTRLIPPPETGRVYPNPSDLSSTFVELSRPAGSEVPFRVIDLNGRMVCQGMAAYSGSEFSYALPDLSYLSGGIYFLQIGPSAQAGEVYKLIRQ